MVRPGPGPGVRALVLLLVYGFPGGAARHGGEFDECGPAHALDRRGAEDAVSVSRDFAGADRNCVAHAAGGSAQLHIATACRSARERDRSEEHTSELQSRFGISY